MARRASPFPLNRATAENDCATRNYSVPLFFCLINTCVGRSLKTLERTFRWLSAWKTPIAYARIRRFLRNLLVDLPRCSYHTPEIGFANGRSRATGNDLIPMAIESRVLRNCYTTNDYCISLRSFREPYRFRCTLYDALSMSLSRLRNPLDDNVSRVNRNQFRRPSVLRHGGGSR